MARAKKLPIFERYASDGRFLGYRVRIRQQIKGQEPVQIQRQFDRIDDARTFAVAELDRINAGKETYADRREAESTTLSEALDRYLAEVIPGKKGEVQDRRRVEAWKRDALASRSLASIKGKDLAKWRDVRATAGIAAGTIRRDLAVISHLFTVAVKDWGMGGLVNPVENVRQPKPGRARDRRLDSHLDENGKSEGDRLLAACDASPNPWLAPMVRMALETAMRQSELLGLKWKDVDLGRKVVHLEDTKNGERRDVPLSSAAVDVLKAIPRSVDGRVFAVSLGRFNVQWRKARKAAGCTGLRFHDLRHEATSRLFEKGLNPMEAAAVTGHKSLSMLKRYTHLRAEDLARKLG